MESLNIINEVCYTDIGSAKELIIQDNQRQAHWAYIAGVMDSDGCFMITRHKRQTKRKNHPHTVDGWCWTYLPSAKIAMIQDGAIKFILKHTGLGTYSLNGARPSRPNSMPIFQWGMRKRDDLIPFLEGIIPWLQVKRNRAEFLLEYCKKLNNTDHSKRYFGITTEELVYREESYQKMRKLNALRAAAETKPLDT